MDNAPMDGGHRTIRGIINFGHMETTGIKKELQKTERLIAKADSQRDLLWGMILPYMSEEFHDESCYIDVAHGDGLVVVLEELFGLVRNYPVEQIVELIEEGVECITPDQLTSI